MHVARIHSFEELAPWRSQWNNLAGGVPFRGWEWLETWWRHYGAASDSRLELFVLAIFDRAAADAPADRPALLAVAPWFLERTRGQGRVVRFLGCGEVCTDYVTVLCRGADEAAVAEALADWLSAATRSDDDGWDLLEVDGVDGADTVVPRLLEALTARGCSTQHRAAAQCWRIPLPGDWDEYLALLSKNHRKQIGRLYKNMFEAGRGVAWLPATGEDCLRAVEIFADLHQKRWQALGLPGCFSSPRYAAFQREVIPQLFATNQLRLCCVELESRVIGVEYCLAGGGLFYAYQSGIDPEALKEEPGRLAIMASIRRAINEGAQGFDFLRGDEPYKAHWRAAPRPMLAARAVPPRLTARLRNGVWTAGDNLKTWIKSGLQRTGLRSK